jgi:hypothetical protein
MTVETFFVKNGKPIIYKNQSARLLYGYDLSDWLDEIGTTLESVTAVVVGVAIDGDAFHQDGALCAWITGLDETEGAVNSCCFSFVCADGSEDERTIYFQKRPA